MADDEDDETDREAKTPNNTGSFAFFHDAAVHLAERLERIAHFKEKVITALDMGGARQARALAFDLIKLAERFASWPTLNPETVAFERPELVARLFDIQREAEEMAAATKGLPPEEKKSGVRRTPMPGKVS